MCLMHIPNIAFLSYSHLWLPDIQRTKCAEDLLPSIIKILKYISDKFLDAFYLNVRQLIYRNIDLD